MRFHAYWNRSFSIEHGHANHRSDDWSSTAYWYQQEPHAPFRTLPSVEWRMPLPVIKPYDLEERKKVSAWAAVMASKDKDLG